MRFRSVSLPLLVLAVLVPALPVRAAVTSLTLTPPATVLFGDPVTVHGSAPGAADGDAVELVDVASGTPVAPATTVTAEAFSFSFPPSENVSVKATAPGVESGPVDVLVAPRVTVSLGNVRLFDNARISGTVQPSSLSGEALVRLVNGDGATLAQRTIPVSGGAFATTLRVSRTGAQRAVVRVAAANFAVGEGRSAWKTPPLPNLRSGSRGIFVLLLERRLNELRYKAPKPDRRFTFKTGDAVLAFRKVQRQRRARSVGAATWRALANPAIPRPRFATPDFHIEVDQSRQVLYVVRGNEVRKILHVSTGGPGVGTTRNGSFRVWLKFAGYSPKGLYMPAFFDGQRGIHGWPEVPPVPASHGCVRVPMWTARWIYGKVRVGTVVRIYGQRR